jgi:hypothetical protein
MKGKLGLIFGVLSVFGFVLAGCATLKAPGSTPELTDFIVLLIPDVENPQWQPQNEFTTTDEVEIGIHGTDVDKDVRIFIFTIRKSDGTLFDDREMTPPGDKIETISFTRYFGYFTFPVGAYTFEVFAVDAKRNKSNTLKVDFTVK